MRTKACCQGGRLPRQGGRLARQPLTEAGVKNASWWAARRAEQPPTEGSKLGRLADERSRHWWQAGSRAELSFVCWVGLGLVAYVLMKTSNVFRFVPWKSRSIGGRKSGWLLIRCAAVVSRAHATSAVAMVTWKSLCVAVVYSSGVAREPKKASVPLRSVCPICKIFFCLLNVWNVVVDMLSISFNVMPRQIILSCSTHSRVQLFILSTREFERRHTLLGDAVCRYQHQFPTKSRQSRALRLSVTSGLARSRSRSDVAEALAFGTAA